MNSKNKAIIIIFTIFFLLSCDSKNSNPTQEKVENLLNQNLEQAKICQNYEKEYLKPHLIEKKKIEDWMVSNNFLISDKDKALSFINQLDPAKVSLTDYIEHVKLVQNNCSEENSLWYHQRIKMLDDKLRCNFFSVLDTYNAIIQSYKLYEWGGAERVTIVKALNKLVEFEANHQTSLIKNMITLEILDTALQFNVLKPFDEGFKQKKKEIQDLANERTKWLNNYLNQVKHIPPYYKETYKSNFNIPKNLDWAKACEVERKVWAKEHAIYNISQAYLEKIKGKLK